MCPKSKLMRTIILMLLAFVAAEDMSGQMNKLDYILSSDLELVTEVDRQQAENKLFVETAFASAEIIDPAELNKIKDNVILEIQLVFTTFRSTQNFEQEKLNRKRLQSLKRVAPIFLHDELINWRLIGQTGCSAREKGNGFFHGFIISYRPKSTAESVEKEIEYLDDILHGKSSTSEMPVLMNEFMVHRIIRKKPVFREGEKDLAEYISKSIRYPEEAIRLNIEGSVSIDLVIDKTGEVSSATPAKGIGGGCEHEAIKVLMAMPHWKPGTENGKPVETSYTVNIRFTIDESKAAAKSVYYSDSYFTTKVLDGEEFDPSYVIKPASDSTILKVFSRNPDWKNMSVICDLTGSMSPYTVQLLIWHKLNFKKNSERTKLFTFFNDGDYKHSKEKQIGKTGGIYMSSASNFADIERLAKETMRNGYGGDRPENNVEALITAIENCKDCEEIVMIADNYATPRDLELLNKINKPIKIILCGASSNVNVDYLNMARKTKGSIHTMEEDIVNLMELNEDETIVIGNRTYRIKKGKFVALMKL